MIRWRTDSSVGGVEEDDGKEKRQHRSVRCSGLDWDHPFHGFMEGKSKELPFLRSLVQGSLTVMVHSSGEHSGVHPWVTLHQREQVGQ